MDKSTTDELTYYTEDLTTFKIISKHYGDIGFIVWKREIKTWCFLPINDFFYKPVIVALILTKLNYLNGYKKEVKK